MCKNKGKRKRDGRGVICYAVLLSRQGVWCYSLAVGVGWFEREGGMLWCWSTGIEKRKEVSVRSGGSNDRTL